MQVKFASLLLYAHSIANGSPFAPYGAKRIFEDFYPDEDLNRCQTRKCFPTSIIFELTPGFIAYRKLDDHGGIRTSDKSKFD